MLSRKSKIYIAGHTGMVGSAICRFLLQNGYENLTYRSSSQLDLRDQAAVNQFFKEEKPEIVVLAAAKVGGIHANNTYPAEFIHDNLVLQTNVIHAAYTHDVQRLLFLGSTCIYPKHAPQPIPEEALLTGPLEQTNEAYAIAKIAGLKMCQFYRREYDVLFHSAMPTNLYGPGDNYHSENSHVLPALIRRFHEAKQRGDDKVVIWGSGNPCREFLYVDDMAEATLHLLTLQNPPDWVNVGMGKDIPIGELAQLIAQTVGFNGRIENDLSKPDGTFRKLTDISRIRNTGWQPKTSLQEGLKKAYQSYLNENRRGSVRK